MAIDVDFEVLPHQWECLTSEAEITSMSCGRGAGKTSALCIIAAIEMAKKHKTLVIEPTYSQFNLVFAPEMDKTLSKMRLRAEKKKSPSLSYRYGKGEIICISGEAAENEINSRLRGISDVDTLLIDECSSMSETVFNLAIPVMRAASRKKIYLVSTSTPKSHWFCKKSMLPGTKLIYASSKDNPFNGKDYYDFLLKMYENLPKDFIEREIYGRFTDATYNTIFMAINPSAAPRRGVKTAGLDLALGGDFTAFAMFDGNVLAALEKRRTATVEEARAFARQMCAVHKPSVLNFDVTGHGSYAEVDRWGLGCQCNAINFGASAGSRYANMRTKLYFDLYFKLREFCNAVEVSKLDELREELQATTIDERERAKIILIPKEDIIRLIGRSPDFADAAALASLAASEFNADAMRRAQMLNNPWA